LRAARPACSGFTIVPKFSLKARRFRRGDGQRVAGGVRIEAKQARCRGSRTDRTERRRAVPSPLVVARIHRPTQPAFDFEPDDVGVEECAARRVEQFLQAARPAATSGRTWMGKRHEAHVVEVQSVRGGAVGQRGRDGDAACASAEHASTVPAVSGVATRATMRAGRLGGAGEGDADRCRGLRVPPRRARLAAASPLTTKSASAFMRAAPSPT
jgi:hypothetical protein